LRDAARAVEEAVLAMNMKVAEHQRPLSQGWLYYTRGRGRGKLVFEANIRTAELKSVKTIEKESFEEKPGDL